MEIDNLAIQVNIILERMPGDIIGGKSTLV